MKQLSLLFVLIIIQFDNSFYWSEPVIAQIEVNREETIDFRIANWKNNKKAALTLQFDDCTPGQATLGLPAVIKRKLTGTWFINPGKDEYKQYKNYWENMAPEGGQELANHTMTHTGAKNYQETVYEVGEASKIIWKIRKQKENGSLIAFNRGGGTSWDEDDLKKVLNDYHNIDRLANGGVKVDTKTILPGSSSDEIYETVPKIIESGLWGRLQFHGISAASGNPPKDYGNGAVYIKEFEDFLDKLSMDTSQLWIAGYIQIYKYLLEKKNSRVEFVIKDKKSISLYVKTSLDQIYFDEPLTVLANLPTEWKKCKISSKKTVMTVNINKGKAVFDVKPGNDEYLILKL
ncbi:MAG: polysaccharide deacetylase family protein [Bacteroidales bacterium]